VVLGDVDLMLTWTEPFPGTPDYHASLETSDPAGVHAAIVETWTKFLDHLDAVPAESWTMILAYLVVETGGLTLYPSTREEPGEGMDNLSVTLSIDDWAAECGKIADECYGGADPDIESVQADPKADARYERQYDALLKKMARSLKDALTDPALALRFAALKKRSRFAIYYVDQGETVHTANLVYLWGERPPKGFPAETPRILFTGLMNKAGIWPDDCLKFDGDKVLQATFFGNDFNDKYVDILESVPNVAILCKDLRTLTLDHTRIKPAGVERLKALFPRVKVKIKT
jgi:hypothetical protein